MKRQILVTALCLIIALGGILPGQDSSKQQQKRIENLKKKIKSTDDAGQASKYLMKLAKMYSDKGWDKKSVETYKRAYQADETNYLALYNAGVLYQRNRFYGKALSVYNKCLKLNSKYAPAHYNLGTVLDKMDRYDEAIRAYKKALSLDPSLGKLENNPQLVNNKNLSTVKLLLYLEKGGSLSLPQTNIESNPSSEKTK